MAISFFLVRIIVIPNWWIQVRALYITPESPEMDRVWNSLFLTCGILDVLNIYWFGKIVMGAWKVLQPLRNGGGSGGGKVKEEDMSVESSLESLKQDSIDDLSETSSEDAVNSSEDDTSDNENMNTSGKGPLAENEAQNGEVKMKNGTQNNEMKKNGTTPNIQTNGKPLTNSGSEGDIMKGEKKD